MGVRLPAEYQEVEYLGKALTSSNTTDVYIDTGILTSSKIDYDFAAQALGNNETVTFFGGRDAFKSKSNEVVYVFDNEKLPTGAQFRYGNKSGDSGIIAETPAVNIHEVKHYKKDGTTFTCNNSSATTTKQTFSFNKTITLFDVNQRTRLVGNLGGARIYYFKLYEDGELVRSFIPCYRKTDDKPGMYDLVTKQFFTNAGTGEFTVGPDVIDSISPWLVARRRALMARVESEPGLDTSPRIAQYGVRNPSGNPASTPYIEDANYCVTAIYAYTAPAQRQTLTLYGGSGSVILYDNGTYKDYWLLKGESQPYQRNVINPNTNGLSCTLRISMLDDSYAFITETGQILFAGRNSIYYGHRNINELN